MATIRKLPSGRFNVQIRKPNQPNKSATFDTNAEAKAWVIEQEKATEPRPKTPPTFLELAMEFCERVLSGRASYEIAQPRLQRIAKQLPTAVDAITKQDVNNYRLKRLKEVSGVTCRDDLQLIQRVYKWAYEELILDEEEIPSPVKGVPIPPPSKPRSRVVEKHELEQLLSVLTPTMASIVELAWETAMRRSEIIRLTPKVLDLDNRCLDVINGKTGDRVVPLTRRAVEILRDAKSTCMTPNTRIFKVTPRSVTQAVRRARRQTGLDEDVRLHQMRHSRVTMVARKGLNQAQIMMVSGHKDVRSVQRYTHLSVKDVLDVIDD